MKNWVSHFIARVPVSVQKKLLVAFLVIVTLLITFGFVVLEAMSGINRRVEAMITLHHKTALINPNERKLDSTLRQLHQFRYDLERVQFVTQDEVKLFEKISQEHEKLIEVVTQVIEQIRGGRNIESVERTFDRGVMLSDRLERLTNEMVNRAEADMIGKIDESVQAYLSSRWVVIGFALGSVLLALVLGYSISSSLLRPMKLIDKRLSQTASGDFTQRIHVPNRDEIGTLADNLNIMNE